MTAVAEVARRILPWRSRARVAAGVMWGRLAAAVRRHRHPLTSGALIVAGLGGALGGGALIGEWMLGLVLIAESAGLLVAGLLRDDGGPEPPPRGAREVEDILDDERLRP